jgi:DNA-binding transcriptional ArsR family regulator
MKQDVFQAIADPTRRAILTLLAIQALTPNAMAAHFDMSRQAVSKHIKVLQQRLNLSSLAGKSIIISTQKKCRK